VVPAHVRKLRDARDVETLDLALDPAEARELALVAAARKHLHSDTDAEQRLLVDLHRVLERLAHSGIVEAPHRPIEGAHSGQNDPRRGVKLRAGGGESGGDPELLVDIRDGADVSQAIVDDSDHRFPPTSNPTRRITFAP